MADMAPSIAQAGGGRTNAFGRWTLIGRVFRLQHRVHYSVLRAMSMLFSLRSRAVPTEGGVLGALPSGLCGEVWTVPCGLGGCSVAQLLAACPDALADCAGVVLEALDPRVGNWQYSLDAGASWRSVRTDILHSRQPRGLVLALSARLRVLPYGGSAHHKARMVWHTVTGAQARHSGCYCPYVAQERDGAGPSVALELGLADINGTPLAQRLPRQRNKRALAALRRTSACTATGQAAT